MKKNYFMLAAATMMFAACAETDLVNEVNMEEAPKAIGFDAFANKTTRAAIENAGDLKEDGVGFHVWGYKTVSGAEQTVFSGDNVYWEAGDWAYNNTRYWDKKATSYNFYAVAPQLDVVNRYSISDQKKITINNVASGPANTATDYLIDRNGVTVDNIADNQVLNIGEKIGFNFSHIMSKITVQVKHNTTPGTGVNVVLTDLTMSGWNESNGTFTQDKTVEITTGTPDNPETEDVNESITTVLKEWELTENNNTDGTYTFLESGNTTLDKTTATTIGSSYLMVPQTITYVPYAAEVKDNSGETITEEVLESGLTFTISYRIGQEEFTNQVGIVSSNQTWATNTHYTYTIIVGPNSIQFGEPTITNWATGNTGTGNGTIIQ